MALLHSFQFSVEDRQSVSRRSAIFVGESRQIARMFDTPESGVYLRSTISREIARFKFRRLVMALWNDQTGREKNMPEPVAKAPEKVAVLAPVGDPSPRPVT